MTEEAEEPEVREPKNHLGVGLFGIILGTVALGLFWLITWLIPSFGSPTPPTADTTENIDLTWGFSLLVLPIVVPYLIALTSLVWKWPRWRVGALAIMISFVLPLVSCAFLFVAALIATGPNS